MSLPSISSIPAIAPVTIQGTVVKVDRAPPGEAYFTLEDSSNKKHSCFCPYFFPVQLFDVVQVVAQSRGPPVGRTLPKYNVIAPPLGLIPTTSLAVAERVAKALHFSIEHAQELTTLWISDYLPEPVDYLERAVEIYCQTGTSTIKGLNDERSKYLTKYWHKQCIMRRAYLFGLNNREINAAREQLLFTHREIYDLLLSNPLALPTITMEKAKDVLSRLGQATTDEHLTSGYIVRTLYDRLLGGWTSYPVKYLNKKHPSIVSLLPLLTGQYGIVGDLDCLYFRKVHELEMHVAEQIQSLSQLPVKEITFDQALLQRINGTDLSPDQVEALEHALQEPISIVTGKAGTGKTTLIARMVAYLRYIDTPYLVCSFTGKAVARIKEVLEEKLGGEYAADGSQGSSQGGSQGMSQGVAGSEQTQTHVKEPFHVSTISRYVFREKLPEEAKVDLPKLDPEYIIIDEMSMTTMSLFSQLLSSIQTHLPRIIMVGDINQLPPVGWGSLFGPCFKSGIVPVYKLTQTHRFVGRAGNGNSSNSNSNSSNPTATDGISLNSEMMVKYIESAEAEELPWECNTRPIITLTKTDNFQLIRPDIESVGKVLKGFYSKSGVEHPEQNLTVICPYNATVKEINLMAQEYLFGKGSGVVDTKGNSWHLGERVMMLKNDYQIMVMNGEEGIVTKIRYPLREEKVNAGNEAYLSKVANGYAAGAGGYAEGARLEFGDEYRVFKEVSMKEGKEVEREVKYPKEGEHSKAFEVSLEVTIKVNNKPGDRRHWFPLNPKIEVDDDEDNEYTTKESSMRLFALSYALTVHKSQGSEWPYCIVFIPKKRAEEISNFISRNLLYTGTTRARSGVFFAVDPQSLKRVLETGSEKPENLSLRIAGRDREDDDEEGYDGDE